MNSDTSNQRKEGIESCSAAENSEPKPVTTNKLTLCRKAEIDSIAAEESELQRL